MISMKHAFGKNISLTDHTKTYFQPQQGLILSHTLFFTFTLVFTLAPTVTFGLISFLTLTLTCIFVAHSYPYHHPSSQSYPYLHSYPLKIHPSFTFCSTHDARISIRGFYIYLFLIVSDRSNGTGCISSCKTTSNNSLLPGLLRVFELLSCLLEMMQ